MARQREGGPRLFNQHLDVYEDEVEALYRKRRLKTEYVFLCATVVPQFLAKSYIAPARRRDLFQYRIATVACVNVCSRSGMLQAAFCAAKNADYSEPGREQNQA